MKGDTMILKGNYKDREVVRAAVKSILKFIQPGDVVNQVGHTAWWRIWLKVGFWYIRFHQRRLFGRKADWHDIHTMMFFDRDNTFSVEPPHATMKPIEQYCLSDLSIFRLRLKPLTLDEITYMRDSARDILGTDYDFGQLIDIAIHGIMGFPDVRSVSLFDFGRTKKVCAVGVRTVYEHLYREKLRPEGVKGKWLFEKLNPEKWSQRKLEKFEGTDIELTTPAHFANPEYFQEDFELIARFRNGVQIYPG